MEKKEWSLNEKIPWKLEGTRAWRTYRGGKLLDKMKGEEKPKDGYFPEEWIISTVAARNTKMEGIKEEGINKFYDADLTLKEVIEEKPFYYLGREHAEKYGSQTGVLVKIIDAAERLTIQSHPDKKTAKELFDSDYGKTECWHILDRREMKEGPCVYIGFKEGVSENDWRELFEKQDVEGMLNCLHKFAVKQGETYLIEGGIPHAIGAGCFLAERCV